MSARVLVETDVLVELARPRPAPGVLAWAAATRGIALSVVSLEELRYVLAREARWLDGFLATHCEILDVTAAIATLAGTLRAQLSTRRQHRHPSDMLLAATAAHHGLTLVTGHVRAFRGCGVALINPFA